VENYPTTASAMIADKVVIQHKESSLPLMPGDPVQLDWVSIRGRRWLAKDGRVWVVQRIHPAVFCLKCQPGVLVQSVYTGIRRWITFPKDRDLEIIEKLTN